MRPFQRNAKTNRGFSLVELMVALTLGLIILSAVSMLFVSSKKTYTSQDRQARLQENSRFAMHFIVKDLRLAGYYGCVDEINPDTVNVTLNNPTGFVNNVQIPLEGLNNATGTWYPSGDTTLPPGILPGTDAVTVRSADATSSIYIEAEMPNSSAVLDVNSVAGLSVDDIIMVSDCASADVMQVTQVINQGTGTLKVQHNPGGASPPGNSTQKLSKAYSPSTDGQGTRVMKFTTKQYFIATGASGNPALFRKDNNAAAVELVDGVENMQILYGKDTDGDKVPNIYLAAGAAGAAGLGLQSAADWSSVVSVRIGILARTVSDKDTDVDTNSYDVDGNCAIAAPKTDPCYETPAQNDHHKRRVFQAVVHFRNL